MMHTKKQRIGVAGAVVAAGLAIVSPAIASAVSNTANTTINATVAIALSITSSSTVSISVTPTSGGVVSSSSDTVTVNTNDAAGYTLTLADSDTNTNLVSGGNNIAAHSGTQASPTALTANKWGYAVATVGGFDASYSTETNNGSSTSKWAGVPSSASPNTLKTTSSTASNDTTTVWYAANASTAQPNGTYTDQVTYTATSN
jgi:hypothetical protein